MRGGRKTLKLKTEPSWPLNCSGTARNLNKSDLGGVIFGCTYSTIDECYSKKLFGLPSRHISYVRNIDPGLPLFLFSYSDRKLYGIFEAASKGILNINSSAWSADGSDSTPYAAQVKFRIHMECQPLLEDQFSSVIYDNYYEHKLFWFELDRKQTRNLISLFSSSRLLRSEFACSSTENSIPSVNLDRGFSKWGSCSQNISSFGGDTKSLDPLKGDMAAEVCLEKPLSEKTWSSLFKGSATSEAREEAEGFRTPDTEFTLPSEIQCNIEFKSSKFLASSYSQTELLYPQKNHWENYTEQLTMLNHIDEVSNSSAADAMISKGNGSIEIQALESNTPFADKSNTSENSPCDHKNLIEESQDFNVLAKCRCNNLEWCICTTSIPGELPSILVSKEELALEEDHGQSIPLQLKESKENCLSDENAIDFDLMLSSPQSVVAQFLEVVKHMKSCQLKQALTISALEQDRVESRTEIQHLKERCRMLERYTDIEKSEGGKVIDSNDRSHLNLDGSILIVGGWNGGSWSSTLECYPHSLDFWKPIASMRYARLYASAVKLNNEVYIFGGKESDNWDNTVESYNLESRQWFSRPQLNQRKRNLAGVTLSSKIFAIGGANELEYFSDVEMLDLNVGKWIPIQSMTHKRFALAAAEIGGVLYAVGGYDGNSYLKSVERLDPREFSWRSVENMSSMRGCLSLATLILYAMGGYDGNKMVPTVEVFDPRKGSWMMVESMHDCRGYFDSVVLGDTINAIGGVEDGNKILDTVECYKEGSGWEVTNLKAVGKRCYFSAMVM